MAINVSNVSNVSHEFMRLYFTEISVIPRLVTLSLAVRLHRNIGKNLKPKEPKQHCKQTSLLNRTIDTVTTELAILPIDGSTRATYASNKFFSVKNRHTYKYGTHDIFNNIHLKDTYTGIDCIKLHAPRQIMQDNRA